MDQMRVKVSAAIANEWSSRAITDVIPDLPEYEYHGCVLTVPISVAREILADCEFNGDAKCGPEEMPGGDTPRLPGDGKPVARNVGITLTQEHTMATMIERIESRAWVAHVDDERDAGNGYMVMLSQGYDFADDPGCGVRGFDTLREVEKETRRRAVVHSAAT